MSIKGDLGSIRSETRPLLFRNYLKILKTSKYVIYQIDFCVLGIVYFKQGMQAGHLGS